MATFAGTTVQPAQASNSIYFHKAVRQLPVAAEYNVGYSRDAWRYPFDADRDCRNTRAEVLQQETKAAIGWNWSGCTAVSGRWFSYFDGRTHTLASAVQIDHLVPLHEAHGSGGAPWGPLRKRAFANDLADRRSLNAMTSTLNSSKSARDPGEWLPPAGRCRYVAEWTAVKLRWGLRVDSRERAAVIRVADSCPNWLITYTRV